MALIFKKYCTNTQQRIEITNCEHRCLLKMTHSFVIDVSLPASLWLDTAYVIVFIINRLPSCVLHEKSPGEVMPAKITNCDFLIPYRRAGFCHFYKKMSLGYFSVCFYHISLTMRAIDV